MTAAIFSIGTELTRGELVNGNAAWLSARLVSLGFEVTEHLVIDDDIERIVSSLRALASRHSIIVTTGGLGPTTDDLTAEAVAKAMGVGLERREEAIENMRRRFAALGRPMPEANLKQADVPAGAIILPNVNGTAPGFAVEVGSARAFFMPGVPSEMHRIFDEHVSTIIAPLAERTTAQEVLRTFGLGESAVGEKLAGLAEEEPDVTIGYRWSFPEVEVKFLARGATHTEAKTTALRAKEKARERLGEIVYGEAEDSFPLFVGRTLRDRGHTLALAESCTGGLIGQMVTSVSGSSDYLLLDAVTYSNASKMRMLGIGEELIRGYGAVSAEIAIAMADGAMRLADSSIALGVTGIAGPTGGTEEKPVGTVFIALARKGQPTEVRRQKFGGNRDWIRTLAAYTALRWAATAAMAR